MRNLPTPPLTFKDLHVQNPSRKSTLGSNPANGIPSLEVDAPRNRRPESVPQQPTHNKDR